MPVPECRDPHADNHSITIRPAGQSVQVHYAGHVIADSSRALLMEEDGYPTRVYIPPADIRTEVLHRSDTHTRCPYKGEATYYDLSVEGKVSRDAIWTYEAPCPAVAPIVGHFAFHESRVERIVFTPPAAQPTEPAAPPR